MQNVEGAEQAFAWRTCSETLSWLLMSTWIDAYCLAELRLSAVHSDTLSSTVANAELSTFTTDAHCSTKSD